jgi:hypothetical protein
MPDKDGKLTTDEKNRVVQKLQTTWMGSAQNCPICGNSHWLIADHLVQPLTLGPNASIQLGGAAGYPQVMLISVGCGHTLFFNAVMLGVLAAADPQGPPVTPPSGGSDAKS